MTSDLLSFLEYCNNFKAVSIYPYSLLTSYFLSQLLPYNSSKHCYKISLSLSFRESSQASHCLQNKSNTIIFAYNALHSMLPPYISILITFLSVCLSLSLFLSLSLCCLYLLHYLQFPHRPLLFHSPNLLNVLSAAWMPSISLVGVL